MISEETFTSNSVLIDYVQTSMDDFTAYIVDTMHDEVDNPYTMPHKTTSSKVEWPRFEQGATYFDSISSSHPRWRHHDKRALAHQDTQDHQIVHQAQCQHDLPRPPSRWCPQYTSSFTNLRLTDTFIDTTTQQALRQREHQEQLRRQRIRERKRTKALECLKQEHHEEPKPQDSWWTMAHRTRLSSSRSFSCSNHVDDHERRRQQPQEHGANHEQPTRCPQNEEPRYENVNDNSSRRTTTRAPRLPSHEMSYHDATLSQMVSPIPHATIAKAPTRRSHRHEKHSKAHDCHHQRHHEHPQQAQEQL
jgi:hypothetical protein